MEVTSNVTPQNVLCWLSQGQIPREGWDPGDSTSTLPSRVRSAYAAWCCSAPISALAGTTPGNDAPTDTGNKALVNLSEIRLCSAQSDSENPICLFLVHGFPPPDDLASFACTGGGNVLLLACGPVGLLISTGRHK